MISQIALIFIVFLLLLTTVLVFINKKTQTKEDFKLPTQVAANVPAGNNTKGKDFYVGNDINEVPDEPIVESEGKYQFRKQQLLYDGVWGEDCKLDGQGGMKCDWKEMSGTCPLNKENLVYGTDQFFQEPKKYGKFISPPDCPITAKMYPNGPTYMENARINPPMFLDKPTVEDILGFDPATQDNTLYWNHPNVILSYL